MTSEDSLGGPGGRISSHTATAAAPRRGGRKRLTSSPASFYRLLQLDGSACILELLGRLFGVGLGDALLDVGGGGLHQVLGLLEPQGGHLADALDDVELVG